MGIVSGSHLSFRKFTRAARGRVRREGRIEHGEVVRRLLGFSEDCLAPEFAVEMERSGESFPGGSNGKESAYNAGDLGLIPESGRSPGERKWQPTSVFLPGESHEQRSLAGYSPWGRKGSGMT